MQDAENVAVPEAAEERAEPGQQQPAAEPPPAEGLLRPAGPGAPEAAGTEASSEKGEAPGEHARDERSDSRAQAASEDAGGNEGRAAEAEPRALENGDADEPSFSDPEDFVDDVSEEGEGARGGAGERRGSVARVPEVGDVVGLCHRFVQKFH
ncbi:eukaryotic translation initiation factor 3 subunit B-like isoform X2 [Hylobates moloch]|uniref:eukaryotic translation initiation factor 3 subunit B-like isoform X2 n=1 Tax=Hylobates moloch TaxID=81572 RepID=UPI002676D71A|nr:eukaryotic translation initiation factor 3 subunit B-like isoform X2 [Hylobates moloch]